MNRIALFDQYGKPDIENIQAAKLFKFLSFIYSIYIEAATLILNWTNLSEYLLIFVLKAKIQRTVLKYIFP